MFESVQQKSMRHPEMAMLGYIRPVFPLNNHVYPLLRRQRDLTGQLCVY